LQQVIAQWQMQPQVADSAAAGWARLEEAEAAGQPFRLILVDEQMPAMDGFQVLERIRSHPGWSSAVIMMLTSLDPQSSTARCRQLGAKTYLIKPIKPDDLLMSIRETLGYSRAEVVRMAVPVPIRIEQHSLQILVAEDNSVNQRVAVVTLQKMGHRVVLAANGVEAFSKWSEEPFDLIFMDVQMPEMDGFEATRRIRQQEQIGDSHTAIIAMTAHAMTGDRELCIAAGMDDYVTKPLSRKVLEQAVEKHTPHAKAAPLP
jgi:two-component system, sensor histidine kinase and response regulator